MDTYSFHESATMKVFSRISLFLQRIGVRTEVEEPVRTEDVVYEMPQDISSAYMLKVNCEMIRIDEGKRPRRSHLVQAQDELGSPDFWQEWLSSTMRDAVEATFPNIPYDSWSYREPQIEDIQTTLRVNPHNPVSRRFRVVVRWKSTTVAPEALDRAVEWRIGDRMCQYGCGDEEAGWRCLVSPTLVKCRRSV